MLLPSLVSDISSFPQIRLRESLLDYSSKLANFVHGRERRRNGSPYVKHLEEAMSPFIESISKEQREKFRVYWNLHDVPEDSVASRVSSLYPKHVVPLSTFYDLFLPAGDEIARDITAVVGLVTKEDIQNKANPEAPYHRDDYHNIQYGRKFYRILGRDKDKRPVQPLVLGTECTLEQRVKAAIVAIGDLYSNGNSNETLDETSVKEMYANSPEVAINYFLGEKYLQDRGSTMKAQISLGVDEFTKDAILHFKNHSIRNAQRIVEHGTELALFVLNSGIEPFMHRQEFYKILSNIILKEAERNFQRWGLLKSHNETIEIQRSRLLQAYRTPET